MKKITSRTLLSILAVTVWALAMGVAGPVAADNGEYVKAIHVVADHHATPNTIVVYNVPEEGYPMDKVTEFQVPSHGIGAGGLATFYDPNGDGSPEDGIVFVTFENLKEASSARIEMFRAVSGDYLGSHVVTGAQDLAGIVVDQAEGRLYVLDRFTNDLYVFDMVVNSSLELIPIPGLPIELSNIIGQRSKIYFANKGAVGLALDEERNWLFVTDITPIVRYYDTNTWAEIGTLDMNNVNDRPWWEVMAAKNAKPISIAYDPEEQLVFIGGGYRFDYYLRKYDMRKEQATFKNLTAVPGMGAIGVAFDTETDLLYVTTGYEGDDVRIYDKDLNEVYTHPDTEGLIKNPAGICIGPPAEQQFLHLSKDDGIADDQWVVPGGNIAYDLCVENPAASSVENVLLTDDLPVETEFLSASDGGVYDSYTHTVTWELGTIQGTGSICVDLVVTVKAETPMGTVVVNASVADSDQTPPTSPATEETLVGNGLVLTKEDDVPDGQWVEAGEDITYEMCVENLTPFDVHDVTITDTLPQEAHYLAASEGGEYDPYSHTVTWDLGTLLQGGTRCVGLVVEVDPSTTNGTILTNTSVAGSEETGPTDPVTEETAVGDGLVLTKDDGLSEGEWVQPGESITYAMCLQNLTPYAAHNVTLTDDVPPETDFVSASDQGIYTSSSHQVVWNLGTLAPGENRCVELMVSVKSSTANGTNVTNACVADSDETDPTDPAMEETLVGNGLVLTKDDGLLEGEWVGQQENITYELCVENLAPLLLSNVSLTDTLPLETDFVSASQGGLYESSSHTVTWHLNTLEVDEEKCVQLTVNVNSTTPNGTIVNNSCVAHSDETGPTDPAVEDTPVGDGVVVTKDDGLEEGEWVEPGGNITYELCVENLTPFPLQNATITDTLPEGTQFVSASSGGTYQSSTHTVEWNLGIISATENQCVSLVVTVESSTACGTILTNCMVMESDETGAMDPICEDTPVGCGLLVTKEDNFPDGAWVEPGEDISYALCIENLTPFALNSVTITDTLPAETDFVSASDGGAYQSGAHSVTWDIGNFATGQRTCVDLVVNVKSETPHGTVVHNSCIADSDETGPTDPAVEDTPVGDGVVVTKDDGLEEGEWVEPGANITYELCVENLTPFPLQNATITDTLPAGTQFVSASGGGTYQSSTHTVEWNLGMISTTEKECVSLVVTVDSSTACGAMLTNCMVMESDETGAMDPVCEDTPVGCGLVLTKDDGVPQEEWVKPGENISYALCVENLTPFALNGVTLADTLPPETEFVSASEGGTYHSGSHVVTWNLGSLATDEMKCVELVVNVEPATASGTVLINQCVADSDETDPTDPVVENTPVGDDLVVSKNDGMGEDEWVEPGDNIAYDLCVENLTPFSISNTTLTDTLPPETDFVSASDQGQYQQSTHTVTWNLGVLEAAQGRCVELIVNVSPQTAFGTLVTNTCVADSDQTDPTEPATEDTAIGDGLVVSKNDGMSQGEWVEPGQDITYGLCVTNFTPFDVHNTTLTDTLPDETEFVSASNGGTYASSTHTVTWNLGTLGASEEACVDLVATVKTDTPFGTVVLNSCVADSDETDPTPPVTEDTPVGDGLVLTKNDGLGQGEWVEPGEEITYEVCVRNFTPFAVNNATLTDTLPAETDFVDATEGGNYSAAGHTVTWNLGRLAADEERCVGLVATVKGDTPFGTFVRNSCVADSDETDPTEPVIADTPVGDGLVITKDDGLTSQQWVEQGENITYAICVENLTPFAVHNATIRDTLPLETTFVSASDEGLYSSTPHTVTWNLGTLEAGQQTCVQLVARVRSTTPLGTLVTNTAFADSNETDPTDPVIEETLVADGLVVRKDDGLGPDDCVETGELITYDVCVENQTPIAVHNVTLTDHLDAETIFLSASHGGTYNYGTHTVTWAMGDLDVGEEQCVDLVVQVDPATRPATIVTDSCVADSDETDPSDPDTENTNICAYIDAGARPEFDAVGCDATNYFAAQDTIKQLVVENGLDSFGTRINLHSDFEPYGDESFTSSGGQPLPDPCFPGYMSALTDVWNEGIYQWDIVLQMKPESDIDLNIVDCVMKRNGADVWSGAEQTGRYRAAWGELFFVPTGNPRLTVEASPGPYPTPGFDGPFYLDARTHPGLTPEPLVDAPYTSKAFWEEGIIVALPETGTTNGAGQMVYNLKQGDIISVQVAVPAWNTVDVRYGRDSVILKYVGILGTEHLTDEPCAE